MHSHSSAVSRLLVAYRGLLEQRFGDRLISMRLFGSRARGDARADSDVDIAIVIRALTEKERSEAIRLGFEAWLSWGPTAPEISPLVWSDVEHANCVEGERRIALDIENEGIPI